MFLLKLFYSFVYVPLWYTNIFSLQNVQREWRYRGLIVLRCRYFIQRNGRDEPRNVWHQFTVATHGRRTGDARATHGRRTGDARATHGRRTGDARATRGRRQADKTSLTLRCVALRCVASVACVALDGSNAWQRLAVVRGIVTKHLQLPRVIASAGSRIKMLTKRRPAGS